MGSLLARPTERIGWLGAHPLFVNARLGHRGVGTGKSLLGRRSDGRGRCNPGSSTPWVSSFSLPCTSAGLVTKLEGVLWQEQHIGRGLCERAKFIGPLKVANPGCRERFNPQPAAE